MSLIFGLKLPSDIYAQHNFFTRMENAELPLPRVHIVAKNRLTQYINTAKSYVAVLSGITEDLAEIVKDNESYFTFSDVEAGMFEIKDFQTAGVVAFARGAPFVSMHSGTLSVAGQRVKVNKEQLDGNREIVDAFAKRLWS